MSYNTYNSATGEDRDRVQYEHFKAAYRFETKRNIGENHANPYWRYLLLSFKRYLFEWFPELMNIYYNDALRLKNQITKNPSEVPADFLEQSESQSSLQKQHWTREDKDLINFVNNHWDDELMGKFSRTIADRLCIAINQGPTGPTAQERILQDALKAIKNLIVNIPPRGHMQARAF